MQGWCFQSDAGAACKQGGTAARQPHCAARGHLNLTGAVEDEGGSLHMNQ